MLIKNYTKSGNKCRVTFKLPAEVEADTATLCGDFNDWEKETHPMKKLRDGSFSVTVSLDAEKSYRFRYWLDGTRWENDWEADDYLSNAFGSEDSVIEL